MPNGLPGYAEETTNLLIENGVMWNGVPAVKIGAIIIGIILGTLTAFVIDKRLDKAGICALVGAALSLFGLIHNAEMGFYPLSPFAISYVVAAALLFIMHRDKTKWNQAVA